MFKKIDALKENIDMYYKDLSEDNKNKLNGTGIFRFIDDIDTFILFLNNTITDKLDKINLNHVDLTFEHGNNEREKTYGFLKHEIYDIIHNLKHKE